VWLAVVVHDLKGDLAMPLLGDCRLLREWYGGLMRLGFGAVGMRHVFWLRRDRRLEALHVVTVGIAVKLGVGFPLRSYIIYTLANTFSLRSSPSTIYQQTPGRFAVESLAPQLTLTHSVR